MSPSSRRDLNLFPTLDIYISEPRERDMRRWANSTREAITSTATAEEKKNRCGAQLSKWKSSSAQREYEKVNLLIAAAAPLVQINRTEFLCGQHFSLTACRRPQLIAWGTHKKKRRRINRASLSLRSRQKAVRSPSTDRNKLGKVLLVTTQQITAAHRRYFFSLIGRD